MSHGRIWVLYPYQLFLAKQSRLNIWKGMSPKVPKHAIYVKLVNLSCDFLKSPETW